MEWQIARTIPGMDMSMLHKLILLSNNDILYYNCREKDLHTTH